MAVTRQGGKQNRQPGRRAGDAHRREIERLTRELLDYAAVHPLHRFAVGTRKFLEEVRPIVEQLDVLERPRRAAAQASK